ncbi:MAG: hypothetical protein L3J71_00715 [Victivallaceae bacterium]|nr:hypothetical protein [Victivallaceae bacterium]
MLNKMLLGLVFFIGLQSGKLSAGDNLLKNAQFNETKNYKGQRWAQAWQWGSWGKGKNSDIKFELDDKICHSPKYAAFLSQAAGDKTCQLLQKVKVTPVARERQLKVVVWIFSEDSKRVSVVVIADTAKKKAVLWKSIASFKGSFDWKKIEKQVTIPADVNMVYLSLRIKGPGMAWFDDCEMSFIGDKKKSPATVSP